jgi:hypothetical protein
MDIRNWKQPLWVRHETILDRRIWVYYLVIRDAVVPVWEEQFEARPDEAFFERLGSFVAAYVNDGKRPPEEIAPAVMNVADDYISGRDLTLRAGDYIALQSYMRQH